jgi:hypothetical protein
MSINLINDLESELISEETKDAVLDGIAESCYQMLDDMEEDTDEVVSDGDSFRMLLGAYVYLYEKYRSSGIESPLTH